MNKWIFMPIIAKVSIKFYFETFKHRLFLFDDLDSHNSEVNDVENILDYTVIV